MTCKRGHDSPRNKFGDCYMCARERQRRLRGNPDYYAKDLERNRKWKKNNPEKVNKASRVRKLTARANEGTFNAHDIALLIQEQGNLCPGCFSEFNEVLPYTIDHFVPIAKGGTSWPHNLQLLCRSCNCQKKDRLWREWKV